MKALIISPSLDSSENVSGISSVVKLIVADNHECQYSHFRVGKVDSDSRLSLKWMWQTISMYPKWMWLMIVNDFDIIHFNLGLSAFSVMRDYPLIRFAKLLDRNIVIHVHGGFYMYNEPGRMLTRLVRRIVSKVKVIALTSPEKEILMNRYKARSVSVLPNCIDLTDASRFNIDEKDKSENSILYIGRITREKGLQELLDVMTSLKKEGVHFHLYVAGTGPDEAFFIPLFSKALGDSFTFLNVISGDTKVYWLKRCRISVLPSYFEGLPVALLETMSFGEAPVATAVGSIATVVDDNVNGLLVEPKDTESLAKALMRMCVEEGIIDRLAVEVRATIFEKFRTEIYMSKLNDIYKGINCEHDSCANLK